MQAPSSVDAMRGSNTRTLTLTFAAIGALIVLAAVATYAQARRSRHIAESIVTTMVARNDLTLRIQRDFEGLRLTLDDHVILVEEGPMRNAEATLTTIQSDIDAAARRYNSLVPADPRSETVWRSLNHELAEMQPAVADVVALSRLNRDAEAFELVRRLEPHFRLVDAHLAELIRVDHEYESLDARRSSALTQRSADVALALDAAAVVATLLVGIWVTRIVRSRDAQRAHDAEMLVERNRDLDAFAGRVAHDLRNPLAVAKLSAYLLEKRSGDEGALDRLSRSIGRMETMIADLLALSRSGSVPPDAVCDIGALAWMVADELRDRAESEGVSLHVDVVSAQVRGSDALLRQALNNLVDNAVKYKRPGAGARVDVSGTLKGRQYELRIADNGIGLSPDEVEQLFVPFYRAPGAAERPGTGLGLTIVKRIVEASGGKISVTSVPGEGTTFVLTFESSARNA